jgi:hypothetical protein
LAIASEPSEDADLLEHRVDGRTYATQAAFEAAVASAFAELDAPAMGGETGDSLASQ